MGTANEALAVSEENVDGTLVIHLDRPRVLNSFDDQMLVELAHAFRRATLDPNVEAVVLTGRGRAFCAGADVKATWDEDSALMSLRRRLNPVILVMAAIEKPVIAAINGVAAGAGIGFAGVADVRICSDEAIFVPATVNLGIAPDGGMSYFIPRLIGHGRAFKWLSGGDRISASTALEWGLVDELCEPQNVVARAMELATQFRSAPDASVALTKRLLANSEHSTLAEQLELEHRVQDEARARSGREFGEPLS